MRKKKLKTFVITLSNQFMSSHPRAGESTNFRRLFLSGVKLHTIRLNISYWSDIVKQVNDGKAVLSVREWTGRPYNSKQRVIKTLTKDDGIGVEIISFQMVHGGDVYTQIDNKYPNNTLRGIAENDGLTLQDFRWWFFPDGGKVPKTIDAVIIHFTGFRYRPKK